MTLTNVNIVLNDKVIKGSISFEKGKITSISEESSKDGIDCKGVFLMPGFIDIHIHGSMGVDFMDAKEEDYKIIANSLYKEGVTTFLATTLTSDKQSLAKVCSVVSKVKDTIPSLGGIHFEGPYISLAHKGAQNPDFIRNPDIKEFDDLQKISGNNIRYITLAPENPGALEFIKHVTDNGVTVSAGHSDASFEQIEEAIGYGLTNITHTHNAMSGHHHRHPGIVSAAFYFDSLNTEFICDKIHVVPNVLKMSYKLIGPERFIIITDALKIKHTNEENFELFGLPCHKQNGAAYLLSGPLAGSILTMDQGLRNMKDIANCSLVDLAKITSRNAARAIHLFDRGEIKIGNLADFVLLDKDYKVISTYKLGQKVY